MWTNIFRIGGLHQLSWFQFLPNESDVTCLPDKSSRAEQRDAATLELISSHVQLQKDGFLSTWTNSFVGPWDPSQGTHNPDEKIKLWLFLPGRHSSVSDTAQPAVCRLRVIASGLWISPGDSEEVATALSQALKSRLERALIGLSYVRYGDVFSRYRPFSQSEELFRKGQPTIEFVFAASEDAIFVHAILSAKHVRTLSGGDMEKVLKLSSSSLGQRLPVVVSPHGMCGKVTGCCSSDLVKQVFVGPGASNTSTGLIGLPYTAAHTSGGKLGGQNYYLEVTLGCSSSGSEKVNLPNSNINCSNRPTSGSPSIAKGSQKVSTGDASNFEKTFIYPSEAVLVPILQTSYARAFLKRFWLPNWTGLSLSGSTLLMHCCGSETDDVDDSWSESDGISLQHRLHSSSNSNNSSISSISSSSSDSDCRAKAMSGDLEGDADSLTGRQSGLSSIDPMDTNGPKQGAKRPRTGADDSYIQAGTVGNVPKHEYSNSGIPGVTDDHVGSEWDWDDDDRGGGMDIQALLSEFGDFGDFFENDALPFGEPPGTAESQAHVYSGQDCGDGGGSPSGTLMDVQDPMLLPASFQMFESLHSPSTGMEECVSNIQEATKCNSVSLVSCAPAASNGEIDHVLKAEALLTFAPEYGAVETPSSELSSTVFRSPYQPKSQKAESLNSSGSNYVYGATPPSSPGTKGREENPSLAADSRIHPGKHDICSDLQKLYTQIERGQTLTETMSIKNSTVTSSEGASLSLFSGFNSSSTVKSVQDMTNEVANSAKQFFLSQRTVPSVELECLMFQAFMCRIRHTLLPFGNPASTASNRSIGNMGLGQLPGDPSGTHDNFPSKSELRKKDSIPVRIAGDFDGGMLDSPFNAPIGVWRSVGTSKSAKPAITPTAEVFPSSSQPIYNEEAMISYRKRQPLQDFLDAMPLLVQQAASFVDVAFDGEYVDGPYSWLALQEQCRRGFCCGPHMAHAGCGGILASCHSFDIAGVDLLDPVSADVQASSVISLLQSDVKTALKSAFGSLDGPLFVTDWCKGRSLSADAAGTTSEGFSAESTLSEYRDSSITTALSVSDPVSPSQSTAGMPSGLRDGSKGDDTGHKRSNQELCMSESEPQLRLRRRPSLLVIPSTSILVGYQDDWLKTSASSLQLWEKAPLEPYAFQKHVSYYAVCPNIDSLTMMAADFFQELGSVYEMCKLGSHSPLAVGNQMDVDSGKCLTSGFVLLDIPQSVKVESTNASGIGIGIGSISDFYLSLSSSWDIASYLRSLAKALKTLQLGSCSATNAKDGNNSSCTVIYVVCPFPDPTSVLQTIVESSVAVASVFFSTENDKRAILHSQVAKALNHAAGVDEASISNIPTLSGFSIPRIVLQIVPIDAIFRVSSPSLNELVLFKEIAFTVYNKARRILRGLSNEFIQSSTFSGRSSSMLVNMANPIPGMWKDCVGSRFSGSSLSREGEFDPGMRAGTWDNSWQTARAGGLSCDANRSGDALFQEQAHYMFEPLFILAEPGSAEHGVSPTPIGNVATDDSSGGFVQNSTLCGDTVPSSQLDGSEGDSCGSGLLRSSPSLHCCYGWTEDWRWLVCIWTDSRGELLDNHIFPFGGISSRQDTKGMQNIFVQVLQQGCQLLQACATPDNGVARARDFVITRIGCFYKLECQEWQKALYSIGGSEVKKWPLQLRRTAPDGMPTNSNGASLQQQEIERSLPSSPNPLYSPHSKSSGFMKTTSRKQLIGGPAVDGSRGSLQWVQSISFVSVSVDHSLHLVSQADVSTGSSQGSGITGSLNYVEGFTPVRSLGSTSASYILIPSPSMHFLTPFPLQLPTCLTSESPPLAHLLHSKGYAIPLSTGYVVSKAVPTLKKDINKIKEEWPSVLSVSLVDFYGGCGVPTEKLGRALPKQAGRGIISDVREYELEIHSILESVMAELHGLSWLTVSPAYLERRTALPFHCDMVLRLRRLLYFAEKEISGLPERPQL